MFFEQCGGEVVVSNGNCKIHKITICGEWHEFPFQSMVFLHVFFECVPEYFVLVLEPSNLLECNPVIDTVSSLNVDIANSCYLKMKTSSVLFKTDTR